MARKPRTKPFPLATVGMGTAGGVVGTPLGPPGIIGGAVAGTWVGAKVDAYRYKRFGKSATRRGGKRGKR